MKNVIRKVARKFGYEIARTKEVSVGFHKHSDLKRLLAHVSKPLILDIGANAGQTVEEMKALFPESSIHSFEPSPKTFQNLASNVKGLSGVKLNNFGIGSTQSESTLLENTSSVMTSFLEMDKDGWGDISRRTVVRVETLDAYCETNQINRINILKTDTQGYDLHVLKGAQRLFEANAVDLVLIEITFSRQYKDAASFDEIWSILMENGFRLVSFYNMKHRNGVADWCDAIFIHGSLLHETDGG